MKFETLAVLILGINLVLLYLFEKITFEFALLMILVIGFTFLLIAIEEKEV